jgi:hypothetical protein
MVKQAKALRGKKKIALLKKRLVALFTKVGAVIGVLAVLYIIVSGYAGEQEEQIETVEREIRQTRSKINTLKDQFVIYDKHFSTYSELNKGLKAGQFGLNVQRARIVLDALRKRHRLENLQVEISPLNVWGTGENTGRPVYDTYFPMSRSLTLNFSAISDLHARAFVQSIQSIFPAFVLVEKMEITQTKPLSTEVVRALVNGEVEPMVDAEIVLVWAGIEEKAEDEEVENDAR